ncbi:hypothetical protein ABTP53_19490, partial [Acinetobacter baumannii]
HQGWGGLPQGWGGLPPAPCGEEPVRKGPGRPGPGSSPPRSPLGGLREGGGCLGPPRVGVGDPSDPHPGPKAPLPQPGAFQRVL